MGIEIVKRDLRKVLEYSKNKGLWAASAKIGSTLYWRVKIFFILRARNNYHRKHRNYQSWIERYKYRDSGFGESKLKISIIVPVYNVPPKILNKCIKSVINQSYRNWELCLYDDASTKKSTKKALERWGYLEDKRIKIDFGKINKHISGASNEALKLVTGSYVALLDNDDILAPNALIEVAKAINKNPEIGYIYSDEDKVDEKEKRFAPYFKPDWNPDLLLSQMYTCHLSVYKTDLLKKVGGFRLGYEGSQDYDLALRVTEKLSSGQIYHIPKVLYHWRTMKGSTATGQGAKNYTFNAAKKALADYMKRNNIKGEVEDGIAPGSYRLKRLIIGNPSVDIIIPFRDKVHLLKRAVATVLEKTEYDNYQIVLVDNGSIEAKTKEYLQKISKNTRIKLLNYNKPFNYSAINNYAVSKSIADYVLLLNNDIAVISGEWLTAMLEHAQRTEVGAVGAKLLYPDGRVQHAGVVLGMGIAGHSHKFYADNDYGYFSQLSVIRNYSAVTAACLLVSRAKYQEVGGLDEKNLKVAYNDVDFCLKLLKLGYLNVYTPYAKLYHYESASRGYEDPMKLERKNPEKYKRVISEIDYMQNKWKELIENDPNYNPNLSRVSEDFSLRFYEDEI